MIKRIIGIIVAIASLAVIVLAALHHGSYTSMIEIKKSTTTQNENHPASEEMPSQEDLR